MKNVKRCSLSGIAFTMDTDAYETLNAYMDSLRASCGTTPDGDEIVADIEARIAELILSTCSAESVVELPLVENIIRQMGSPEDISSESESADNLSDGSEQGGDGGGGKTSGPAGPRIPRRLYRDMEGAKLGGVCTGLARYFNTDPVWIRLIFLLPLLMTPMSGVVGCFGPLFGNMFCMFILAYAVMWFAVPAARSARQKLEMNGERITAQSIRDTTMAAAEADADSEAKPVIANVVTVFGKIVLIMLKILAGILVFGLVIAAFAMIIGMMVVIISNDSGFLHSDYPALISALGISVALVPVVLLIYVLISLIASRKPQVKAVVAMFLLWIVVAIALIAAALSDYNKIPSLRHGFPPKLPTTQTEPQTEEELQNAQPAEVVEIIDVSEDAELSDAAHSDAALPGTEEPQPAAESAAGSKAAESRPAVRLSASDGTENVQITFDTDSTGFTICASKSER